MQCIAYLESRDYCVDNTLKMRSQKLRTFVTETEEQLIQKLRDELIRCSSEAIKKNGVFRLGLSGGSLVQFLTKALETVSNQLDIASWRFFFCDERYVPHNDADSTYGAYQASLLPQVSNLGADQFIKADTNKSLDECASDYESRLKLEFNSTLPRFDLLLLGMGPDGHTCSLFPDDPMAVAECQRLVIPIRDSPKPPPERITFTLPLINNASDVIFVLTGAGKADVVERAFVQSDSRLPAALVQPTNGQLTIISDLGAGKSLLTKS